LLLPLSSTITPLIDFALALVILSGLMIYYHFTPTIIGITLLPLLILLSFLSAAGLGSVLAAINVRFRDIRYALPFFIQTLFFLTPVIYPTTLISEKYRWILALNPMTGIIEAARTGIVGNKEIDFGLLAISAIIALSLFIFGIFYFRKTERIFADVA
jgi:lipopolysaccharide transport system permease protein